MPRYQANKPGFWNGRYKKVNSFVTTDKKLKPVPEWLTPVKEETPAQRKKRVKTEAQKAAVNKKRKAAESVDINEVNFTDGKAPRPKSTPKGGNAKGGGKTRGAGVQTL